MMTKRILEDRLGIQEGEQYRGSLALRLVANRSIDSEPQQRRRDLATCRWRDHSVPIT